MVTVIFEMGLFQKVAVIYRVFGRGSQCQSGRPVRKYKLYEIRNLVFSTNEKWFPPPASPSHLLKIFETNSNETLKLSCNIFVYNSL